MVLDQRGFGVVEGLLIVVAIGILAGVGFYVVSFNKEKPTSTQSTNQTATSKLEQKDDTKKFLDLTEMGVKLPINNDDLSYGYGDNVANILSKNLISSVRASEQCPDGPIVVGKIKKVEGLGPSGSAYKQLDGYYLYLELGEGGYACDQSGKSDEIYRDTKLLLQKTFENAEKI